MEDVFDFLARVGVSDPGKVLTAARLGPYATANDFAALTDLSLKSVPCGRVADDLRRAREGALRESGFLLEFSGTRGCSFGQYSHSEVGGAPGRPGQTYAGSLRLSRLATSPCLAPFSLPPFAPPPAASGPTMEPCGPAPWAPPTPARRAWD